MDFLLALFLNDPIAYQQQILINYITKTAEVRQIDPNGFLMLASCESRLNPEASGDFRVETGEHMAQGIYQFWPGTWDTYSKKYGIKGKRTDAFPAIDLASLIIADEGASQWENCNKTTHL